MSAKQVRALLKDAKTAVANKEYEVALFLPITSHFQAVLTICEKILGLDKKNFNAVLFTALAYTKLGFSSFLSCSLSAFNTLSLVL